MKPLRPVLISSLLILMMVCSTLSKDSPFFFPPERVQTARDNIARHEWAATLFDSLKTVAERVVGIADNELTHWIPEYTPTRVVNCPQCGTYWAEYIWQWDWRHPDRLQCRVCSLQVTPRSHADNDSIQVRDPQGKPHWLPVHRTADGQIYQFRERAAYQKLSMLGNWLEATAAVTVLTGEKRYARALQAILYRLATVYPGYALHDWYRYGTRPWNRAGKISGWNYQDATLLVSCGKAYDAIRNETSWTPSARQHVLEGLFRSAADLLTAIAPEDQIINDAPFRYAGVATCGRILQDPEVMRWVLNPETGVVPFLLRYWHEDGSWCERAPSYHLMALRQFHQAVEAVEGYSDPEGYDQANRIDDFYLQDYNRLQLAYESLFDITYPDGSLPPINDSHVNARPRALLAEAAYAWYRSPKALVFLAKALGDSTLNTGDLFSLFHRPVNAAEHLTTLDPSSVVRRHSINPQDLGLAIIRSAQQEPETMFTVQYGGIHGGHDHQDKLDLTLFSRGHEMLSDLGYVYSNFPIINTWMRRSLAHNTLTVDRINQSTIGCACNLFYTGPGFQAVETDGKFMYYMTTNPFVRQMIYVERDSGDYIVDIIRVNGGAVHDWSAHAESKVLRLNTEGWTGVDTLLGQDYAYRHLTEVKASPELRRIQAEWSWNNPKAHLRLHLTTDRPVTLFRTTAPAPREKGQNNRTLPYLIVRHQGTEPVTFIAVWEPYGTQASLRSCTVLHTDDSLDTWPSVVEIEWQDGHTDFVCTALKDSPSGQIEKLNQPWNGRIGVIRLQKDTIVSEHWTRAF